MGFLSKIKAEIIQVIPAIIYFIIVFNFIHFTEGLTLPLNDARHYTYFGITVAAIIMGKVILIANYFSFINAFPNKPLIYNIIWKSILYAVVILMVRFVESFIHHFLETKNISLTMQHIHNEISQPIFWATESWLFMAFLIYIIFTEFTRVLGKEKVKKILWG